MQYMIRDRQACLTGRQEKLLNFLVREYISTAEPVSSLALKEIINLDVCGATIRNDLQVLTEQGFITQPHTSAGRVPTQKAYKYIADKIEEDFIVRQIKDARREMESQMQMMEEIMQTLEQDNIFEILNILDKWHKKF
jgi:heat-inducible transcriptional repressor